MQVEQLLNEKANIEDEGRELDEEQKQLKLRVRTLTEKIIHELKKRNTIKQEAVNQLQSEVEELESQLNSLSVSDVSRGTQAGVEQDAVKGVTVGAFEEDMQGAINGTVTVTEVTDDIEVSKDTKDRKKRKLF